MFKNTFKALLVLIVAVACSSGAKKESTDVNASDANVSSQDLNFDSRGSDSGAIQGLSTINFEYDSARLSASSQAKLKENADWMKANSNLTVQIEGHCDARGSIEYNLALGERRAKTVKDYLVGLGVDGSRLSIISYGKEKLIDMSDTESAHSSNRRANFVPLAN